MTSPALVERARELDDDQPDNICPGCGQDITGWQDHQHHYAHMFAYRGMPRFWVTTDATPHGDVCPWDWTSLYARLFRRELIAGAS